MKYKVIASSSKGNAYLVHGEILIDVGVSYSTLIPYLEKIKIILLTHQHSDHFRSDVIAKIALMHPNILFISGEWLSASLRRLGVSNSLVVSTGGSFYKVNDYLIYPVELSHGDRNGKVLNYGYRIIKDDHKTIHMTDTGSYEGISAKDYNVIALEANHCETLINERVEEQLENGEYSHGVLSRVYHSSLQKARQFIKDNANENTQVIMLHPSSTYLTKEQYGKIKKTQQYHDS